MNQEQFYEETGLEKVPVYWDRRYTKNLDKLSKPVYTVKLEENVEVILRDGTKTYVDVYHPAEIESAPSSLAYSAYGKKMQRMRHGSLPGTSNYFDHSLKLAILISFVQRGIYHIIPDGRGIGRSEGEYLGVYNPQEQEDVCDYVEWQVQNVHGAPKSSPCRLFLFWDHPGAYCCFAASASSMYHAS